MKNNNNDFTTKTIDLKSYKNRYFFIGFLVGIIPYIILICIYNAQTRNIGNLKEILFFVGIITASINAFILKDKATKKIMDTLNIKGAKKIS